MIKLFDFDDMIGKSIVALEQNEDMLRDLQEQYQYVLADEHQDVNGSQNRILELLALAVKSGQMHEIEQRASEVKEEYGTTSALLALEIAVQEILGVD